MQFKEIGDFFDEKFPACGGKIGASRLMIQKVYRSIEILKSRGRSHNVTVTYITIDPALSKKKIFGHFVSTVVALAAVALIVCLNVALRAVP